MIDMYGQEVAFGDKVITWVKEGKGIELKHVTVTKVNHKTIEFVYEAKHRSEHTFFLDDDEGYRLLCLYNNCPNLNGGSWKIVEC